MPLIRLEDISKHYLLGKDNVVKALDEVSFEVENGEFHDFWCFRLFSKNG